MDKEYLMVICPNCGIEQRTYCVYDGSYELICTDCDDDYFIIIKNGAVNVFRNRSDFEEYRVQLFD